jgi:hypothetical protein
VFSAPVRASVIEAEHEKLSEKERQLAEKDAEVQSEQCAYTYVYISLGN